MKKTQSLYSINLFLKTFLLLISVMAAGLYMPDIKREVMSFSFDLPDEMPQRAVFLMLQTEYAHLSSGDELGNVWSSLSGTVFNPENWLALEGFSTEALANEFPEPSESVPPADWFFSGEEGEAVEVIQAPSNIEQSENPRVFIYFTHSRESFLPYLPDISNPNLAHHSKVNITQTGQYFKTFFHENGIPVKVDTRDIVAQLNTIGKDYWQAYDVSKSVVQEAITSNNTLDYFIDVHRDSVRREATTLQYNDKSYAKVAFVVGGEHDGSEANRELAEAIHDRMNLKIPGISRGVYVKKGEHTNGKFNQDLSPGSILLELGGVDNKFEELEATADIFSDAMSEYMLESTPVNAP
ncbi:stage II sporulation protein P [Jeotgalibacillus terrae]|uniref:Stage II sporulation protein P n=1 Tax=Jeotgalibacillus terrae TaxID=587735 RepID=A0ABW5ZGS8_9BACL|nr:stage II sporulation protein P [Jeotgalibacillus terrae]